MALSPTELGILQVHATNNYFVLQLLPDYSAVSLWYDSYPVLDLKETIKILTPLDRANYFNFTKFPLWYSTLCRKIHEDTTVKIFGLTNAEINDISLHLLSGLISRDLTSYTMQELVEQMIARQLYPELDCLIKSLGANGDFLESTILKLSTEVNEEVKRWQSLGLSAVPTTSEISTVV